LESKKARHGPFRTDLIGNDAVGDFANHAKDRHDGNDMSRCGCGKSNIGHMVDAVQQNA
jgi:hypothetical protein